ncbi:MAG: DUF3052 domain-containing protein [Candidatus Nanopelagicales bacterium]|nr:DUF3052 domain-containing protein [Candidatus Nanopelagicales bacterium]MDZ4250783.1 DUF3052 domain-containing protein [Candidatus Nanopelagicales bacterium]
MDYGHATKRRGVRAGPVGDLVSESGTRTPLGVQPGSVVQIVGWDDDCDKGVRTAVEAAGGGPVVGEDFEGVVDEVLLWWRDDDGDIVDGLLDSMGMLGEGGSVWLLTPKPGRSGHVEAEEIADAAPTAGLRPTASISVSDDWHGTRLVPRH